MPMMRQARPHSMSVSRSSGAYIRTLAKGTGRAAFKAVGGI